MHVVDIKSNRDWLPLTLEGLRSVGYTVLTGVLDDDLIAEARERMYAVQQSIRSDVGEDKLERAGELGVLRLMLAYDDWFTRFLEIPEVLQVVDNTVSETAILHLQNGFILPSKAPPSGNGKPANFQQSFHRDFPRHLNGYLASLNTLFAIDEFTPENGGTIIVPGTHQREDRPADAFLEQTAASVTCPAGSVIVFDSTLWHAAGVNQSGRDRLGVNQQFTRSFIKQQVDYVRALGDDVVEAQEPRTQQLLGWYTRVVTSLDEYYRPAEERLYRSGQG
jgi:ectoine hydroxylase-related dioxygenase (phytanoyl-CoA dioxygenase family)